jgi:hypothetical protein
MSITRPVGFGFGFGFGFIITRHVNSELTNNYWNESIKCIRKFYPLCKIVVIDDNSKQEFVKAEYEYQNVEIVNSEFPQRGELLPYYYFHKNRYFNNAVIIHDSVFFHKRIAFEKLERMGIKVIPMWHFDVAKEENIPNSIRLSSTLKNNAKIMQNLNDKQTRYDLLGMSGNTNLWNGCFGVQSFINYNFLDFLQKKYSLFNLLHVVKTRPDRCCLERIMGIIFNLEYPILLKAPSILGPIFQYNKWGYTYQEYKEQMRKHNVAVVPVVKVFSGR